MIFNYIIDWICHVYIYILLASYWLHSCGFFILEGTKLLICELAAL